LSGGFEGGPESSSIGTDNEELLTVSSNGLSGSSGLTVEINFDDSKTLANCTGDLSLIGQLTFDAANPLPADVDVQILKEAVIDGVRHPAHWIRVRRDENDLTHPFVVLNLSTGSAHPDALVTLRASDNINSGERQFTFSGGAVRVVQPIGNNSIVEMICDQAAGDDVIVTVAPPP